MTKRLPETQAEIHRLPPEVAAIRHETRRKIRLVSPLLAVILAASIAGIEFTPHGERFVPEVIREVEGETMREHVEPEEEFRRAYEKLLKRMPLRHAALNSS